MSTDRTLLRHTLATLAYRGGKTIRDATPEFATYGAPDAARTPAKILAHIGDLMDWALSMAEGHRRGTTPRRFPGIKKASASMLP